MPLPEPFPAGILRGGRGTLFTPWATHYEELTNFVSDRTWEFDMNFRNGDVIKRSCDGYAWNPNVFVISVAR